MTILAIGSPEDEHVRPVVTELRRRGERVSVLDLAEFPARARVSVSFEAPDPDWIGEPAFSARVDREKDPVDFADVDTVWLRRVSTPQPVRVDLREGAWFPISECQQLLLGLAQALHDRRWVNPPSALLLLDSGWGKVRQLEAARLSGLEIPRTLMTNDPERARAFVASCPGGAIYKAFACPDGLWTTEVTPALVAALDRVARAPGIFQEKIPKALDLRVTVFGGRFFACGIASQGLEESRLDYRRRCFALPRTAHELPASVCAALVRLHETLGLAFGTCDMVLTPDGRYVFLETNQAGCFLDVGVAPGVDLLGAFCDFLSKR